MKMILLNFFIVLLTISSCEIDSKDYFPFSVGAKWLYSITISSSYTGKEYEKRLMITNVSSKKTNDIVEVSKLHSDGSYYTYEINKKKNQIVRSSVILAFSEGMVEPIKKIGTFFWKKGDVNTIDRYGPDGLSKLIQIISSKAVNFQSGYLYHYAFIMLIGFSLLLTFLILN